MICSPVVAKCIIVFNHPVIIFTVMIIIGSLAKKLPPLAAIDLILFPSLNPWQCGYTVVYRISLKRPAKASSRTHHRPLKALLSLPDYHHKPSNNVAYRAV